MLPEGVNLKDVEVWFQDETRIGQQGSTTRTWYYKGKRPRIIKQQQFISAYIFGAVCPSTGQSAGLVMPYVNKEAMKLHMEEISKSVSQGKHAVVVMDGATWHQDDLNQDNVTMLKLPPYSPELNPLEQVWQYMKQHWLSNRCFKTFTDIVNDACDAWLKMSENIKKLKSITTRKWIQL